MYCSKCRAQIENDAQFCMNCGAASLKAQPVEDATKHQYNPVIQEANCPRKKPGIKVLIGAGSAIVIVGIVLLIIFLGGGNLNPTDNLNKYYAYLSDQVFAPQLDFMIQYGSLTENDLNGKILKEYGDICSEALIKLKAMNVPAGLNNAHSSLIAYMGVKVDAFKTGYEYYQRGQIDKWGNLSGDTGNIIVNNYSDWIDGIKTYETQNGLPEYIPEVVTSIEITYALINEIWEAPMYDPNAAIDSSVKPDLNNNRIETDDTKNKNNAWKIAQAINITNMFAEHPIPRPTEMPSVLIFSAKVDAKTLQSMIGYWWPLDLKNYDDITMALKWLDYDGEGIASVTIPVTSVDQNTPAKISDPRIPETTYNVGNVSEIDKSKSDIDILLLGVDNRNAGNFTGFSDVIIYLRIDTKNNTLKLASLMRNTFVNIDGHGLNKLNSAYSFGGCELMEKTINESFGLKPDYYVVVNFYGMEDIIEYFGGVDINIDSSEIEWLNININEINSEDPGDDAADINSSGITHLNGRQAVAYMRIRPGDDEGSIARQQKILAQLFNKAKSINLGDVPNLVNTLTQYVRTDIPLDKILSIADAVKSMGSSELNTFRYPDDFEVGNYKDKSIVQPKEFDAEIKKLQDFICN